METRRRMRIVDSPTTPSYTRLWGTAGVKDWGKIIYELAHWDDQPYAWPVAADIINKLAMIREIDERSVRLGFTRWMTKEIITCVLGKVNARVEWQESIS